MLPHCFRRYNYLNSLTYDEFGQRKNIAYGNGVKSSYSYDEKTRRLKHLLTKTPDGRIVQDLNYDYDLVGNVLKIFNDIDTPTNTALPAGPVIQKFGYDDLYQLKTATGEYGFGPGKQNNYSNVFSYDSIGNFEKKTQVHQIIQPSMAEHLPKETNYVLSYVYGGSHPHAVTDAGDKLYSYDNSGNMTGWDDKRSGQRRTILWNEENRVKEIQDNGKSSYYLYDDAGERVLKRGQHGETFYINRFFTIRNGELGTKSIYAGNTRLVSKLVKTPNTTTANTTVISTTSTVPGINGLANGQGKKLGIIKRLAPGTATVTILPPEEKDQFFYHGDHLGSSNMITDSHGAIYQHLEYFPYGETWIEEGGSYGGNTPGYKFTGKELDPETGLYYFGARYYDAALSLWVSTDPILGKYLPTGDKDSDNKLPGLGGVMNSRNLSLYIYAHHNPIKLKDPDGNSTWVNNNGDVQAVFNDSNLGIYESLPSGIAGPPQKVGETLFWDSFTKNGSAAQPLGHVNVGSDITSRVQKIADKAKDMSLLGVSLDSRDGRPLDIKASMSGVSGRNKAQEGFLFQKKYVTLRDAGNILYGMNMKNQGLSRDQAMRGAGGWAQTKSMGGAAMGLAGKEYGPAPYFGEDAITGSRIDHGYGLVNE